MSQRKLQQEIDKVFKKVKEGLEVFDGLYDKLQMCESQPQKEKLESDLKKEIKKLQRQRDQIKNWASGNDVKDKKPLLENRRLIENAMERFKEVEKNMKTKAFSKEGLSMQRVDPKQKEKDEVSEFIQSMLDELERQNEKHEALIDQVQSSGKKGRKLDSSKQSEIDDLQEKIERNHWHQEKLEQILRLVANDALDCDQVNALREDITYYVDSNEEADFLEDEMLYEDLGLDDIEESFGQVGEFPTYKEDDVLDSVMNTPAKPPASSTAPTTANSHATPSKGVSSVSTPSAPPATLHQVKSSIASATTTAPTPSQTFANLKPAPVQKPELKYSSVASAAVANHHLNAATPKHSPATLAHSNNSHSSTNGGTPSASALSTPASSKVSAAVTQSASPMLSSSTLPGPPGFGAPSPAVAQANAAAAEQAALEAGQAAARATAAAKAAAEEAAITANNIAVANIINRDQTDEAATTQSIEDLFPMLENAKERLHNPPPFEEISKILETSLLNCPDSLDADKPKTYFPQTPRATPIAYPQEPVAELTYPSIVPKLDLSTLFFNFYYNQGEYMQILSARALVKQGWQFDTVSKKWYHQSEEMQPPHLVSDQMKGPVKKTVWKYFDNDAVWLARRKDDFDPSSAHFMTSF